MAYTKKQIVEAAAQIGLGVTVYSPGDGIARYKFFLLDNPRNANEDWHGVDPIARALGLKEAGLVLDGIKTGRLLVLGDLHRRQDVPFPGIAQNLENDYYRTVACGQNRVPAGWDMIEGGGESCENS